MTSRSSSIGFNLNFWKSIDRIESELIGQKHEVSSVGVPGFDVSIICAIIHLEVKCPQYCFEIWTKGVKALLSSYFITKSVLESLLGI